MLMAVDKFHEQRHMRERVHKRNGHHQSPSLCTNNHGRNCVQWKHSHTQCFGRNERAIPLVRCGHWLVPAKFTTMDGTPLELYKQHYYMFGSYVFRMNDKLWFRRSMLLRGTPNTPISLDINPTFTFREFYSAGIFTRNFKSYGALVQVLFKNWHLGYVFELPGSKDSSVRFTSHEITLGLSIGVLTYHDKVAKVF
jgi:Type IX secretion system membrane protein PorP/SprF